MNFSGSITSGLETLRSDKPSRGSKKRCQARKGVRTQYLILGPDTFSCPFLACAELSLRVLAYCLMPNRLHAVPWLDGDGGLSRWMHWLLNAHMRRYHRHYHSSGHLWQGRSLAFPIQEDEHLVTALRYVGRNPWRAELVAPAEEWPWSSLRWWSEENCPVVLHGSPMTCGEAWVDSVKEPGKEAEVARLRHRIERRTLFGRSLLDATDCRMPRLASHPVSPLSATQSLRKMLNVPFSPSCQLLNVPFSSCLFARNPNKSEAGRHASGASAMPEFTTPGSPLVNPPRRRLKWRWIGLLTLMVVLIALILWHYWNSPLITLVVSESPILCVAFSPDDDIIAAGGLDHCVSLWSLPSGRLDRRLHGHTGPVGTIVFAPDGKTLTSQSARMENGKPIREVKVWDLTTIGDARLLEDTKKISLAVRNVSPDGMIVARPAGRAVDLYEKSTGRQLLTLAGHSDMVNCVAFSPDGTILATGSGSTIGGPHPFPWLTVDVRLWDVKTGRQLRVFRGHRQPISDVAFSPDGRTLASASLDGTVKIWDLGDRSPK